MESAMSRQWRPHLDLVRLSAALAEEILAASEQEVSDLSAASGYSLAGAASEVRELIDAAGGDRGDPLPVRAACLAAYARQH
jgi:hypothetical protein